MLEPTGVWTVEQRAELVLDLGDIALTDAELVLAVTAFVTPDHPELAVQFAVGEEEVAASVFRHGEADQTLHIRLSDGLVDEHGRVVLDLRLRDPMRPVDLGVGSDPRRLGLHLRTLGIEMPETQHRPREPVRRLRRRMWKA